MASAYSDLAGVRLQREEWVEAEDALRHAIALYDPPHSRHVVEDGGGLKRLAIPCYLRLADLLEKRGGRNAEAQRLRCRSAEVEIEEKKRWEGALAETKRLALERRAKGGAVVKRAGGAEAGVGAAVSEEDEWEGAMVPCLRIGPDATWTLRAMSGGYAIAQGKMQAAEGLYRVLMEGIEAFVATLGGGLDSRKETVHYATDERSGRRYISARA